MGVALLLGRPGGALVPAAGFAGVAVLTGLVAYGPFLIDVGPGDLYRSLVGDSSRERDWWTLPFPLRYHGSLRAWPPGALARTPRTCWTSTCRSWWWWAGAGGPACAAA